MEGEWTGCPMKEAIPALKERKKTDGRSGAQRFPSVLCRETTHRKPPPASALFALSSYTSDTLMCLSVLVCVPT